MCDYHNKKMEIYLEKKSSLLLSTPLPGTKLRGPQKKWAAFLVPHQGNLEVPNTARNWKFSLHLTQMITCHYM